MAARQGRDGVGGRRARGLERRRDDQRYVLDYLVMETGRSILFDHEGRSYPPSVKLYRQIPKELERQARHKEDMARAAEAAGRTETACELYYAAAMHYQEAQHVIYDVDNRTKGRLYARLQECFDRVIQYAEYPIEKVEVDWEGQRLACLLHLLPDRRRAPAVLFIPGMDMVKEMYPSPLANAFHRRGMHILSMDGPGQGASLFRKVLVTHDNYERAASAVISYLRSRPEVDADRLGVVGMSMGSYWASRTAAYDHRVKALATVAACYGSKRPIFELASPRFKAVFMQMSGIHDEDEFDRMAEQMTCLGLGHRITCPHLMVVGEFDQLNFLEDSIAFFRELGGPREMWLMEDESHATWGMKGLGELDARTHMADWMRDALSDRLPEPLDRFVRVSKYGGVGPYGPAGPVPEPEDVKLV